MPLYSTHPVSETTKLLLLGDSGAGKTALLASLANAGYNLRIIDLDGGLDVLSAYLKPEAWGRVSFVTVPGNDKNAWNVATNMSRNWVVRNSKGETVENFGPIEQWTPNDVLAIDSGSFWSSACLKKILDEKGIDPSAGSFDIRLYSVLADRMEDEISRLTSPNVKCNVVLTAHLRRVADDRKVYHTVPSFEGQILPREVPKYFNNMFLVKKKIDGTPIIQTQASTEMSLKCTAPAVVLKEEAPDLGNIFQKIRASVRKAKEAAALKTKESDNKQV